jgi:predicted negative regulator of RcsB-dependent stress response
MKTLTFLVALVVASGGFAGWTWYTQKLNEHIEEASWREDELLYSKFCADLSKGLKSPRTAIFPTLREQNGAQLFRYQNNVVEVDSFVDSQNSFGALVRSKWRMAAVDNEGTFDVFFVSLGDQTIGDPRDIGRKTKGQRTIAEERKAEGVIGE